MRIDFERHLDDRVIYVQTLDGRYTVVECERMTDSEINPIPVRMKICRNLEKALEVAEKWAGIS